MTPVAKKVSIGSALLLGCVAIALVAIAVLGHTFEVRLTQSEVQAKVDAHLPIDSRAGALSIRLASVHVELHHDQRAHVEMQFHSEEVGASADGKLDGSMRLMFRDGEFYFYDLRVEQVALEHVMIGGQEVHSPGPEAQNRMPTPDEKKASATRDLVNHAAGRALFHFFSEIPVYTLEPSKRSHGGAWMLLKDVRMEEGVLVAVIDPATAWSRLRTKIFGGPSKPVLQK